MVLAEEAPAMADRIKQSFRQADRTGSGRVGRATMARVLREVGGWSQEDADELLDALDSTREAPLRYAEFVDWIMEACEPQAGQENDPDSDGEEEAGLASGAVAAEASLDLSQPVSCQEFESLARLLEQDALEARAAYAHEEVHGGGGVPLRRLLDSLQVDFADAEALSNLERCLQEARSSVADGGVAAGSLARDTPEEIGVGTKTLMQAVDKIVRVLSPSAIDPEDRPAEDAWSVIAENKVPFSKAGRAAVDAFEGDRRGELVELVRAAMVSPPLLPSTAGQVANRERCIDEVDAISRRCREQGIGFTDPEWDLTKEANLALYVDGEAPGYDCTVGVPADYKRLTEIISEPKLFKGGTNAGDIIQGQIGTCYLLGAMGAVAGNSDCALSNVFIRYDIDVGVYGVRFCLDGEWTYTIIDDYMPVDSEGRLLYAKSRDKDEVWCPLLEKAFCKHHKCYEMCDGGRANEAVFSLFGGVAGKLAIQPSHKECPDTFFKALSCARSRGWLLTTSFTKTQGSRSQGKCGEAVLPTGLVGGHVYSVLRLVEAHGHQLVCCRNPWGGGEWTGMWSDGNKSGEWTPEMKQAVGFVEANDGTFWMSIEDFVSTSGGVEYARTFGPAWKKLTQYKRFQRGSATATAMWDYKAREDNEISLAKGSQVEVTQMSPGWWTGKVVGSTTAAGFFPANFVKLNDRPLARFDLVGKPTEDATQGMDAVVMLMQPNSRMARRFYTRKEDGLKYKDVSYDDMQLIVVGPDGKVALRRRGRRRCLWGELRLPGGGLWRAYALSLDGRGGLFSLRAYVKGGTATLTEIAGASITELPL